MATVLPMFITTDRYETKHIPSPGDESEEGKKNAEEKIEKEGKEIYVNDHLASHEITTDLFVLKFLAANNERYKSCVYLSIPTPPPESSKTV